MTEVDLDAAEAGLDGGEHCICSCVCGRKGHCACPACGAPHATIRSLLRRVGELEAEVNREVEAYNKVVGVAKEDIDTLFKQRDEAGARVSELENVLEYISRPTMALPGDRDPEDFARTDAADDQVRLALATCIHMATEALKDRH